MISISEKRVMEKNLLIDAIGFKKKNLTAEILLKGGINTVVN